ncbi:peptide deformylase [Tepidibacter thalassicus]|uniref:Peptide deformylase n=1 Tax=Tepidibacter thalassicus DSM 15285 TaxID=1123350 RepID=A0A1M5Q6H5_9FIRM|nr:peptide deformylase [Tepidibacter thalassicus]SHH09754.1 peptide deformylase [Tepidibacter thalassicus DSM 15285]
MALRIIRKEGDPVLRKKSKVVEKIDSRIITLLDDMAETMYDADGVGLAAPQVGILKRVVIIDIGGGLIELINPEIIEQSGKQSDDEGCLSVPGKFGKVTRPNKVKVRAFNRKGEEIIIEGEGLLARALCHEIDHLEGILFIDKVEGNLQR